MLSVAIFFKKFTLVDAFKQFITVKDCMCLSTTKKLYKRCNREVKFMFLVVRQIQTPKIFQNWRIKVFAGLDYSKLFITTMAVRARWLTTKLWCTFDIFIIHHIWKHETMFFFLFWILQQENMFTMYYLWEKKHTLNTVVALFSVSEIDMFLHIYDNDCPTIIMLIALFPNCELKYTNSQQLKLESHIPNVYVFE